MKLALLFICFPLCGGSLTEAVASVCLTNSGSLTEAVASVCLTNSKLPGVLLEESDTSAVIHSVVYSYSQFSVLGCNIQSPIFTHLSSDI
jgi:hypothetical protein